MAQAAGVSIEPWDLPWALELANGDRCTLLGGTLTVMAGQTAHYGCENGAIARLSTVNASRCANAVAGAGSVRSSAGT